MRICLVLSLLFLLSTKGHPQSTPQPDYCNLNIPCVPTGCLVRSGCHSGNPQLPTLDENCIAPLSKYLAKSIRMIGLFDMKWDGSPHWDIPEYCKSIKFLADKEATFVTRAFAPWGNWDRILSDKTYRDAMHQVVCDINYEFDCRGLRRPLIQACVFENIEYQGPLPQIPKCVLDVFRNDIDYVPSYYDGTNVSFQTSRMNLPNLPKHKNLWDITKIEARMWFYFRCMVAINAGYTSIHAGQINHWAKYDTNNFEWTSDLMQKVRDYAAGKGQTLIIAAENEEGKSYINNGKLIFDYDDVAMRLREINDPYNYCTGKDDLMPNLMYIETPCENEPYPVFIDTCIINRRRHQNLPTGTKLPNGCIVKEVPFIVVFDFGKCSYDTSRTRSVTPKDGGNAYGWSDVCAFLQMSPECRCYFVEEFTCLLKSIYGNRGFLSMIGSHVGKYDPLIMDEDSTKIWHLKDDAPFWNCADSFFWNVEKVQRINIAEMGCCTDTPNCTGYTRINNPNCPWCANRIAYNGTVGRRFVFQPDVQDCMSTYSWHIKYHDGGDGAWLPFSYGPTKEICLEEPGTYTIYLRQDILDSELSKRSGTVQVSIDLTVPDDCCNPNYTNMPLRQQIHQDGKLQHDKTVHSLNSTVDIFPNPTSGEIQFSNISLNGNIISTYIADIYGHSNEINFSLTNDISSIDLSNHSSGMYFLLILLDSGELLNKKVIVIQK